MTTRAIQIELLLSGIISPITGELVSEGTVEFYSAGTSTGKSVWTEKEKTNAYTEYDLSSIGAAQLYGEGLYDIVVKDVNGDSVKTFYNIRLEFPNYYIRTITSTSSQLSEDDFVRVDTTSGAIIYNCLPASSWTRPVKFKIVSGTNTFTINPYSSQTVDGSSTLVISTDSIVEVISNGSNLETAGFRSSFASPDGDTSIVVDDGSISVTVDGTLLGTPIIGDTSNILVLRKAGLLASNGTNASTLKLSLTGATYIWGWNGDDSGFIDNVPVTATPTGGFTIDQSSASFPKITIDSSLLGGQCVAVLAAYIINNACGTLMHVNGYADNGDIVLVFSESPDNASLSLATVVDTDSFDVSILYLTEG